MFFYKNLYKLTKNITQTLAHDRYATQEICNKWKMPTHLFSVNIDLSKYKNFTFEEKGKWKRCSRCGQIKLAHNHFFSKNNTSKDHFYSICKECRNKKK